MLKTEQSHQAWARRIGLRLLPVIVLLVAAVSLLTPWMDADIFALWFSLPNFFYLLPIPTITALCLLAAGYSLFRKHRWDWLPFIALIGSYLLVLSGLAISYYPWIVPRHYQIWDIAAPNTSLQFALVGVLLIVPIILFYTAHAYYVFLGKVSMHDVYH